MDSPFEIKKLRQRKGVFLVEAAAITDLVKQNSNLRVGVTDRFLGKRLLVKLRFQFFKIGFSQCSLDELAGFTMGISPWRTVGPSVDPDTQQDARYFNLTTVRHQINTKSISAALGSAGNLGANRPLHSNHPGGANVAACDGSVHFLTDNTALQVLFDLADRDDGNVVDITQ